MSYTQLTQDQRYQICALKQVEQTNKRIAAILGVNASTISRELKWNRGKKGYRSKQADQKAQERKHGAKRRIGSETWEYVEQKVKREWSPEQVSGRLRSHHGIKISYDLPVYTGEQRGWWGFVQASTVPEKEPQEIRPL